jgi:hypothetical protein
MHFARRRVEARALVGPPRPYRFTGTRIGGNDSTPLPRGEVQFPAHHDRRRFVRRRLGCRSKVVNLEGPRDLEVLDVVARDLIERRILRARLFGSVGAPFAILGTGLSPAGVRPRDGSDQQGQEDESTDKGHRESPLIPELGIRDSRFVLMRAQVL